MRLHHVNVTVPPGQTDRTLAFYRDVLGFTQVPKPEGTEPRGAWLLIDQMTQLHVSERDAPPSPDAHFALVVDDFHTVVARLEEFSPAPPIFGGGRGFTRDPAGNRIELLERTGDLA